MVSGVARSILQVDHNATCLDVRGGLQPSSPWHPWWFSVVALGTLILLQGSALALQVRSDDSATAQRQQVRSFSTDHLLFLLTDDSIYWGRSHGLSANYTALVEQELIRRSPYPKLFHALRSPQDETQQQLTAEVIEKTRSSVTDSAMRALATTDSTSVAYYAVRYFAEAGHLWALKILADNFWKYPKVSISFYQDILVVFRDQKYAPAVPRLLESLDEFNLTTVGYALEALHAIYPEARDTSKNPEEARAFWAKYTRSHPIGRKDRRDS